MPLRRRRRRPGWAPTMHQRAAWLAANVGIAIADRRRSPVIAAPRLRWDRSPQAYPVTPAAHMARFARLLLEAIEP